VKKTGRKEYWTESRIREVAKDYKFISDLQRDYSGAAHALKNRYRHLKSELFPTFKKLVWTEERLASEALKYNSKSDFRNAQLGAYSRACQLGIVNKICAHMVNSRVKGGFDLGPYIEISGIYFLINGDEVVYIGKSDECVVERIRGHYKDKDFDEVRIYPIIKVSDIYILEAFLITSIKPKYNIEFISEDAPSVVISNIDDILTDYITINRIEK
jgi:hypothetical protein